ncbi:MAG TPA: flagellar biosynthetic protein FliR [Kofleriaceae bacterium]
MTIVILALRGFAAIIVLTTLVGGIPRVVQAALSITLGLWSGLLLAPTHAIEPSLPAAIHELAIGAALGVLAAVPLLAASAAGRLVDIAATGRAQGSYSIFFGVLAAAVFVGIDGHVAVITAIVDSHDSTRSIVAAEPRVLGAIAQLVPAAIRLAIPWLVTAAVVHIAVGVGMRLAARAGVHVPAAAAVPAALVMMSASLVAMLAIAMAAIMRGAL